MGLIGCSRMHYTSVIRGDEVIQDLNIAQGMPELKIMNMEEIYSFFYWRFHDSLANCPPKFDRLLAMTGGFKDKTEVRGEGEEEDELDYEEMTLRQLHSISKSYKRKASKSINLITIKRKMNALCEEDEPDMRETIRSLKRKALKETKAKITNRHQTSLDLCGSEDRKSQRHG